jgi:RNA-dependent RNA polymerase
MSVALNNEGMDNDHLTTRMIMSGIPLDEPFLQYRLGLMMGEERKGLKAGKIPISDSYYLMGTADPTGKLRANQVCVILYVSCVPDFAIICTSFFFLKMTLILRIWKIC